MWISDVWEALPAEICLTCPYLCQIHRRCESATDPGSLTQDEKIISFSSAGPWCVGQDGGHHTF